MIDLECALRRDEKANVVGKRVSRVFHEGLNFSVTCVFMNDMRSDKS